MKKKLFIISLIILINGIAIVFLWKPSFFKKEVIYIAVAAPTDDLRGRTMLNGIELCMKKINRQGGINGKKIELMIYNDNNDPALAEEISAQIAAENKALLVIGHYFSSASEIAGNIYRKNEIPAITGSATSESVTEKNDWYFRTVPSNKIEGMFMAGYIDGILKKKEISIIYCKDSYGLSFLRQIEKTSKNLKMKIRNKWEFDLKKNWDEQSKKIADKLKNADDPGTIIIATHAEEGANIITAIKDERENLTFFGTHTFSEKIFPDKIKECSRKNPDFGYYTDGIYFTSAYMSDIAQINPDAYAFDQEFMKEYHEKPTATAACNYDAMLVAAEAVKKAEINGGEENIREDRRKIREALIFFYDDNHGVKGVNGSIFWNKNRELNKESAVGVYYMDKPVTALSEYHEFVEEQSDNIVKDITEGKIISLDGNFLSNVRIVYTDMKIIGINGIDMKNAKCTVESDIRFRYSGDFDDNNIVFENAVSPITIKLSEEKTDKDIKTRIYRIKGDFRIYTDFYMYPSDRHLISLRFRHAVKRNKELLYVQDVISENQLSDVILSYPWTARDIFSYPDIIVKNSSLGNPEYYVRPHIITYSRFNTDISIRRNIMSSILNGLPAAVMILLLFFNGFIISVGRRNRILLSMAVLSINLICHLKFLSKFGSHYISIAEYVFFAMYIYAIATIFLSLSYKDEEAVIDENQKQSFSLKFQDCRIFEGAADDKNQK